MKSSLGTSNRFYELINLLILENASGKLLRKSFINLDLGYIAPMTGTLLSALEQEHLLGFDPLRVYKIENFSEEWQKMASDSGIKSLKRFHESSIASAHKSSADFFGITEKLQKTFEAPLSFRHSFTEYIALKDKSEKARNSTKDETIWLKQKKIIENIRQRSTIHHNHTVTDAISDRFNAFNVTANNATVEELSFMYLRAICRLYLTDFICADYELPDACADIHSEVRFVV
jgi:hypothetical protein